MEKKSIFVHDANDFSKEQFFSLINNPSFLLEKIVSNGQSSPENEWYDQDRAEWVILLSGSAEIVFDDNTIITLSPGDYILIPAHKRHRVAKTDPFVESVWIAIHFND